MTEYMKKVLWTNIDHLNSVAADCARAGGALALPGLAAGGEASQRMDNGGDWDLINGYRPDEPNVNTTPVIKFEGGDYSLTEFNNFCYGIYAEHLGLLDTVKSMSWEDAEAKAALAQDPRDAARILADERYVDQVMMDSGAAYYHQGLFEGYQRTLGSSDYYYRVPRSYYDYYGD
jgi:hypothetical protein